MSERIFLGDLRAQSIAQLETDLSSFGASVAGITFPHNSSWINFWRQSPEMDLQDMLRQTQLNFEIKHIFEDFFNHVPTYVEAIAEFAPSELGRISSNIENFGEQWFNEWNNAFNLGFWQHFGLVARAGASWLEGGITSAFNVTFKPIKVIADTVARTFDFVGDAFFNPSLAPPSLIQPARSLNELTAILLDSADIVARGGSAESAFARAKLTFEALRDLTGTAGIVDTIGALRPFADGAESSWLNGASFFSAGVKALSAYQDLEKLAKIQGLRLDSRVSQLGAEVLDHAFSLTLTSFMRNMYEVVTTLVPSGNVVVAGGLSKLVLFEEFVRNFLSNQTEIPTANLSAMHKQLNSVMAVHDKHFPQLVAIADQIASLLPPNWHSSPQTPSDGGSIQADVVLPTAVHERLVAGDLDVETLFILRPGQNLVIGQSSRDTAQFDHPVNAYEIRLGQLSTAEQFLLREAGIIPAALTVIEIDGRAVNDGIKKLIGIDQLIFREGDIVRPSDLAIFGGNVQGRPSSIDLVPDLTSPTTPPPPPPALPTGAGNRQEELSVQIASQIVAPSQEVPLSTLFPAAGWINESLTHEITAFAVQDRTPGGGQLLRNGVAQPDQQVFVRPLEELDQWSFRAASVQDARNAPLNIFMDEIGFNFILDDGRFSTRLPDGSGARVAAVFQAERDSIIRLEPPAETNPDTGPGRGANLDVNILGITASQFRPGGEVSVRYVVTNIGDAPALSAATGFYLSQSGDLARDGQLLGTQSRLTLQPGQSQQQTFRFEIDPATTGQFQLGVWANHARTWYDANGRPGIGLQPISIQPLPSNPADLTFSRVNSFNTQVLFGQELELEYYVENIGGSYAQRSDVSFFLSTNPTLDMDADRFLANRFFGDNRGGIERGIQPGAQDRNWIDLRITEGDVRALTGNTDPQDLYLHLLIDEDRRVAEANRANNVETLRFTVASSPEDWVGFVDNRVFDFALDGAAFQPGQRVTASASFANAGTIDAGNFSVWADLLWTNLDTGESFTRGGLFTEDGFGTGLGRSFAVSGSFTLPANFDPGLYEVRAWIRPDQAEPVALRDNNFSNAVRVTVGDVPGEVARLAEALRGITFDVLETQYETRGELPLDFEGVRVVALGNTMFEQATQIRTDNGYVSIVDDGRFAYQPNLPFSLAGGTVWSDTVSITLQDRFGSEAQTELQFNIIGVNTPATIVGFNTGAVRTGHATANSASGRLSVADRDMGENRFRDVTPDMLAGVFGSFMFNPISGNWSYRLDPDAAAVRELAFGAQATDILAVTSFDGTATETISVTVRGGNPWLPEIDRPVLLGSQGSDLILGTMAPEQLEGRGGNDSLLGDGFFAAYAMDEARAIYRLYQATLDRAPDAAGQAGWTAQLATGANTLLGVAAGFVGSQEFLRAYGGLDTASFVTLLYQNVLGRAPDAGGLAGWVAALEQGQSQAQVVLGFSQSQEFITATNAAATEFTLARDPANWQGDVFRLYQATLGREPDLAGFKGWAELLAGGTPLLTAVAGFVNSPEFQNIYGTLDNTAFVTTLYQNVLGRAPDAAGLQGWTDLLAGGMSRPEVVRGFSQSGEFINTTAPALKAWIRAQGVDDVLDGGAGTNDLWGGMMADVFRFQRADGGTHRVQDFEPWDFMDFRGFGYTAAADATARMTQQGADVVFEDQGTTVILANTQLAALQADAFLFA